MKTALSIAGSDTSGGAGVQADLKTMTMNGVFAMSAITALTAQNTTGVQGIFEVTPEFLGMQIDSVFTDIRPDAVKIGMVSSVNLISVIAERLTAYHAENIVVDPVMVATSGAKLISEDAVSEGKASAPCDGCYAEHSRGGGACRYENYKPCGYGDGGGNHQQGIPLCGALQGRTQHE